MFETRDFLSLSCSRFDFGCYSLKHSRKNPDIKSATDGLQTLAPPVWYERYGRRIENDPLPKTDAARQALAAMIGADGQ